MSNHLVRLGLQSLLFFPLLLSHAVAAELSATLQWSKQLTLSTTVTGIVDEVKATSGQRYQKGDVLLVLDQREFKAALEQAKAQRLATQTTHEEALRELERSQELYDRTMLSEHELQTAKNSAAQAKADFLESKARVLQASVALERSRVVAPFYCLVLKVMAQPGQTVLSRLRPEPLALIADAEHMQAVAWVNPSEIDQYIDVRAQRVRVGNQEYDVVEQRLAYETNESGQHALEVIFKSADAPLRAGQKAKIILP